MRNFDELSNLTKLSSRVKEHSSPTVNRRSTDGQSQRQYTIGIWKYVAMMALLLTLACGNVWGTVVSFSATNLNAPAGRTIGSISLSTSSMTYSNANGLNASGGGKTFTLTANGGATISQILITSTTGGRYKAGNITNCTSCTREGNVYTCTISPATSEVACKNSDGGLNITRIDVTYSGGSSTKRIYMKCGDSWCNSTPRFFAHSWGSAENDLELYAVGGCDPAVYYADIPSGNTSVVFTRQNSSSTGILWDTSNFWNKSEDITISTNNLFTCTGWNKGVTGTFSGSVAALSVTYNANGATGSAPTDANSYGYGATVTVLGKNTLTKADNMFIGWNTEDDGTGTWYAPGETFAMECANVTLYAQWATELDLKYVWKVTGKFCDDQSGDNVASINMIPTNDYFTLTGTGVTQESTGSLNVGKTANNYFLIAAKSGYQIKSICFYGKIQDASVNKTTDGSDWSETIVSTNTGEDRHYTFNNINSTHFGVKLSGTSGIWIRNMVITIAPAAAACGATQPGTISKGTLSGCTMRLTASGSPASNNTWYWQASSTGTSTSESGATKDVTTPGTYYIRSYYSTGTCWSEAQSVTVSASDLTPAAPTELTAASATAKGVTLTVTDAANTNDYEFYVSTSSTDPVAGTAATHSSNTKSITITNLYAGTTFYAWTRAKCGSNKSAWTALTDDSFETSTVSAAYHLTNVTKTSGATSGIGGSTFTAVFSANTDYSMPTPVVTIGGNSATSGTDYTWTAGTGTLTINADKINGDIDITMSSPAAAPTNVAITGNYHIYPGETLSLTATPTGGNGPKTYQWQKLMGYDWTDIDDETSNTYTKASVTTSDVGHYRCIVTCGGTASYTSGQFDVKCLQLYVYYNDNKDLTNLPLTKVDGTHATATVLLSNGTYDYRFKITDGCGNWWGNNGASGMSMSNHDDWPLNGDYYTILWTSKAGTYRFNLGHNEGLTSYGMSVVFPSGDQAAGYNLYFANNETNWDGSKIYYRIGKTTHNNILQMNLVPGTANLYKVTTTEYGGFEAWHIANNSCGEYYGTSIYKTNTNDTYEASEAMMFNGTDIASTGLTVIPDTSNHWAGTGDGADCEFYGYNTVDGMLTHTATVGATTNGSIRLNWTDVSGTAQSATSTTAGLAHTCNLQVTAVPATGYETATLTVNGSNHTSGNVHVLSADATIAATFTAKPYTITLDGNGGSGNTSSVTATYNSSSLSSSITNPARDCYTFDGWYSGEGGTGTLIINTSGVLQESTTYTGAGGIWTNDGAVTLYAKWSKTPTALTVNLGGDPATPAGGSPIGTGYTLTCSASTGVIANYQWKQNTTASTTGAVNAEGTGATTASFNPVPAATGTYYYYCVATDACGNSVNTSFSGIFQFNAAAYTVTYNKNGDGAGGAGSVTGTVPTDATSYSSGDRVVVKMPGDLALADKTFIGWNDAANGSGTYYSPGANFAITANKTLYAQWRTASSCPGGEGGTVFSLTMGDNSSGSATSMTKGLSVRLSPLAYATVTNGDASFTNTHTSDTKGSITKANPAALNLGGAASTIILYLDCALRKDDQISFTGINNKEICFSSTTYSRNETLYTTSQAYTIPSESPLIGSRILYIWRKGGDTFGVTGITITRPASVAATITATKTSPDYVSPDPNNLVLSISTTGASSGWYYRVKNTGNSGYQNPDNTPYNTATWTMTSGLVLGENNFVVELYDGSHVKQAESATITVTAETAYPMTIAAGAGGSVSPSGEIKANESGNHIHPEITATPNSGYHFVNWTLSNANATLDDATSATTTISSASGACTITANFAVDGYTVTYADGGATGGSVPTDASSPYVSGATVTVLGNSGSLTKTGYTFNGWSDGVNTYKAGDTFTITADVTLTAQWTVNYHDLTWNLGGGTTSTVGTGIESGVSTNTTTSQAYGTNLTAPTVTKTGYTFSAWSPGVAGTMPDEDVTYTATWTAKTTTITIDANTSNHGSTAPSPITATYGSALPSFTAATGEAGYSLKGYYTDAIGGTKVIDADGTFSANSGTWNRTDGATLELFAQYEDASYGVTHTLSYVTKSSGATTATHGTNYTAVFAAADDYELPASITVTIGGEDATEDTEYTWDSSTGTIEITGSYITGAIVITVTGEEEGDCTPSRLAKVTLTGGDKNVSVADSACTDSHTLEKTGKIGSSGFLQITPLTALKSGDVVTVTINVGNYSESRLYMRYGGKSSTDTVSVLTNQTSGKDATVSFTLTKDSARISFTRATGRTSDNTEQNHILKSVIISRPCAETTYELTWNTNGGSELVCTGTCTSGDLEPGTTLVAPTDPTLSNYTFDGWKTANDGTGSAAAATMPSADTEYFAAWKQTVTLKTGAQGSGADQTPYVYINGTGVNSFTAHTADGYTLQGYYTAGSGGVKVLNADGTFAAANVTDYITSSKWSRTGAAPTLYAQWVASEDCRTLKYAWKITGNFCDDSTSVTAKDTVRFPANASNLYFTESGTGNTVSAGSSYNIGKTKDNYFLLTAKSGYQIKSICFYGKVEDSSVDYTTDNSTWSELKSTKTGGDDYYSFSSIDASYFGIKLTATSPKGIWIRNMVIEVCAEGGTTYNVTYDGNDKTSGSAPTDATNYSYSGTVTVLGNTGSLAKTNYTFAGWTTNDDGTGSSYEAGSTFSITDNTTLYAKWTQAVTFDANTENHGSTGGSATAVWNATGLTGITHATPASGYKLLGYYTAATSGTKVLNSDGSFAETDVTDYITDGKWSRTGTTTLYAQYEVAGSLTWNLVINSDTTSLTTSSKASSFTEILNSNMTNAALVGLDYLSSDRKKKSLTGKISTPTSFDEDKYVSVSFVVADGYKFTPSSAKVIIQPVSTSNSDVKIILSDGTRTITQTKDNLAKGNKDTVTLTNSDATKYMVGTVTMKIYVYGDEDTYRLGTPITIEGEVEEACATMPDYTSMSYTTLDYTIGDTPGAISIVGGENIDTYTWMQNTTNDRTSGSAVSTGTGYDTYSFTPSIASAGTTYYWCEMTNTDCGITIKSSAVAVTVSASKTNPTVTWDPKAKLNGSDTTAYYGGKDYTIKATLNSGWNGTLTADMMTAPAGIRLHDFTIDNSSNPKTIQATFDVQTGFNVDENDSIAFTLSLPETATYNALNSQKKVAYNVCSGGGSADEYLMPVDAAHIDNDSWKGAWAYEGTGMMCYGHGSSAISAGTKDANLKTLTHSMADGEVTRYYKSSASHFGFYTEKAITGVRMYVYTSNTKSTVSGVYISNSASSSSTPSTGAISYEAEYYNDDDGLLAATNDGCTWVEITFANEVPAGKYGQINVSNNVYIAGIALISGSGAGASQTTTLGFASASVSKTQSDANFTYLATTSGENANTLGAITYSSSNTSCATVNATTGEVDITATGSSERSTTITATLAASGCFKGATATYTLTVAGQSCDINAGTLAITAGEATKCAGDNVTLSLSGHTTDGTTVTWYRGETDVTENVSGNALTTSEAGIYSVVVSDGGSCTVRSNAVTISYKSAEASVSKLVDEWYIKQGRLTPDVALFDVADATSWTVKKGKAATAIYTSDGTTTTTGLAGVGFKQVDNIVYLEGTAPTGIDAAANDTIIITVIDACGNSATSDSIVIHKQIATDKHVLAFVVTGTEKGGWTAGISADQTTELQLYKTLTKNFDVVATNIYSTDDEQKLKEYYSQFDILCITDYPNTKTKGVNSKSYVDAIGSLIDIRPILTMEAWVSGLSNWKSKGISGTPHSPSTRQYSMLLQCKDHEIFAGTSLTKIGEGDETMYRVTMVDQTIEEYPTLDGYTPGSKAYDAGGKPALQGFEYTSSMSDLLPIGRIDDGAGNNLQVGIERQHEMEARLLVLGINSYAMERLTVDGEKVVVNALKYLMKKDAEDISDCSVYFDDASGDGKWNNPENWGPSYKTLPLSTQEVRIYKPCIVDTVVRAASVKIIPDGKYSHGAATANGKLTIAPTGALIVDGKIYAATAPNFYEKRTTTPDDLVLEANAENTGTLIFDNEDGETQATVEMYSKSYWEESGGKYLKYWSYVGMPIKDVHIPEYFYGAFTYYYNETAGWEKRYDEDIMQPFEGIGLAMQEGHKETFKGTLASTENVDLKLTSTAEYGGGDNLVSNSWTAPIQISNFDAEDFGTCWAAVYIYNTGRLGRTYVNATAENDGAATAGQWLGIPIGVAGLPEYSGLKVIPAMQGFLVHDTVPTATTLHLDYNKLVRDGADTISQINQPMRAPKQARPKKKKDVDGLLRIRVTGLTTYTDVWMMQDARFSDGYDNGWDAYYSKCDNRSAQLYARSQAGKMAFLAQADLDGTVLGFAPSRDGNDYTFTFRYRGEDEYYLNDLKLQQSVLIDGEGSYSFTYEKGDTNRFYISRTPLQAPQTPTGIGNTEGTSTQSTKAIKVIYNDKLYIIRGGRVYGADGSLVK